MIQEPKFIKRGEGDEGWLPQMAVFLVTSPHPTISTAPAIVTHGTVTLKNFIDGDKARSHYASSKEDQAVTIFREILRVHLDTLENLRALIR